MKLHLRALALVLCTALTLAGCGQKGPKLDPSNPVVITVWHYYNGAQKEAFSQLVSEFNTTEGKKQGIVVQEFSQGSVNDLADSVLANAGGQTATQEMPNIFAAYADTAYAADEMGVVADLAPYLTEDELAAYVDGYVEEGRFSGDGTLKIFPVAKSIELFLLNKTDWQPFAEANGLSATEAFSTIESLTDTAQAYYTWTDAQTPNLDGDGQALFGRDALANYMIIGAHQLGTEILSVQNGKPVLDFNKSTLRKLWDNYYVPTVNGWFASESRFRSDDVKTGLILSFVGSSSGATFFPTERVVSDTESYPVEMEVFPAPQFEGGAAYAVQQGAGMVVTKSTDAEVYASVQFLKWFTEPERNFSFSLDSGYLPVTKAANDPAFAENAMAASGTDAQMHEIISVAMATITQNTMYTTKAFAAGRDARSVLDTAMAEKAAADRAAVVAQMESGVPYAKAVAPYLTDENFEAWYSDTLAQLQVFMA